MSDVNSTAMKLHARSPLQGAAEKIGETTLTEFTELAIVSAAIPLGGDKAAEAALQSAFALTPAVVGERSKASNSSEAFANLELLSLQTDQWFLIFDYPDAEPVKLVQQALGDSVYLTDQSDSWVVVDLNGPLAIAALERICPLDLNDTVFTNANVSRTVMEHLSVILMRTQANGFRLLSPRSSAASIWHALHTSILNVSEL